MDKKDLDKEMYTESLFEKIGRFCETANNKYWWVMSLFQLIVLVISIIAAANHR